MKYLLSIDGGGTKTEFCISNLVGKDMKLYTAGSSNYKSVGMEGLSASLKEGFDWIKDMLSIEIEDIAYGVFGMSGCDSGNDYEIIKQQILKFGLPEEKFYLCNDGVLAFYAQTSTPGIVIISGTGSIVIGLDAQGSYERAGGWGYNISDIGSGYWIGNEAIKQTLLYCDGCCSHSLLFDEIRRYFNAKDFKELPYIITEITDYFEVAKIASIVIKMSESKERVSYNILEEGAKVLSDLTKSIYDTLNFKEEKKISIVFSGGVLKNEVYDKILKTAIKEKINPNNIMFMVQKNSPSFGGVRLARKILDGGVSNVK